MKQADVARNAAHLSHISRPRTSDVVNKKAGKFTIDALVNMLNRIGKLVNVSVR
jgi:predicted XRE-type DNA-binding protein